MGHLINPIALRLGINMNWNSTWVCSINSFYSKLWVYDLRLNRILTNLVWNNSFWKLGLFFSHYKVYRFFNKLIIQIFFYDGRTKVYQYEFKYKCIKKLKYKRFLKKIWWRFFKYIIKKRKNKFLKLKKINFLKLKILKRFKNQSKLRNKINNNFLLNLIAFNLRLLKNKNKFFGRFYLIKNENFLLNKLLKKRKLKKLKNLKEVRFSKKKEIKNFKDWISLKHKKKKLNYKIDLLKKKIGNKFLKDELKNIIYLYITADKIVTYFMFLYFIWEQKLLLKLILGNINFELNFFEINNKQLNAKNIAKFIAIKLYQRMKVNLVLKWVRQILIKYCNLAGFKFQLSGRFTRKQRKAKIIWKYGTLPLNKVTAKIEYALETVILKYGLCGIKVWFHNYEFFSKERLTFFIKI